MKCKQCNTEIADNSVFCEYCGARVNNNRTECLINIQWLLLISMVLVSSTNLLFLDKLIIDALIFHWVNYLPWCLVPVLSFIILAICLVMAFKKRISWIFSSLMFCFFAINIIMFGFATYHLSENCTEGYKVTMVKCGRHWNSDFIYGKNVTEDEVGAKLQEIVSLIPFNNESFGEEEKPYYSSFDIYDDAVASTDDAYIFSIVEGFIILFYLVYVCFARKKGWQY